MGTEKARIERTGARALPAVLAAVICVLLVSGGCSQPGSMTVNGTRIPASRVEVEVDRRLAVAEKDDPDEAEGERGEKLRDRTGRQVATELVRAELIRQQAEKLGVTLPADELNRRLEEEKASVGEQQFNRDLRAQGLTIEQYRETLEVEALVDALGAKVGEGVTVTEDEAESFYLTNKELFGSTLMVHAAHILLDSESQADMVAAQAKSGADFAALAKGLSTDQATRGSGGDLGWIEKGTREPAMEEAIFSLKPGQVSGVVRASDGFHVVKVLERREASVPPYSEVRGQAMNMLANRKKEETYSDWLRTVYANAKVDAGGWGRWDPRLGMVVEP